MGTANVFHDNLLRRLPASQVISRDGMSYMSWANVIKNAGVPMHSCVVFGNKPALNIFNGLVVAVDMEIQKGSGRMQRTWLPVLDDENIAINSNAANGQALFLVQSAIARCRAKAAAMVTGYGLSLYAGYGSDGPAFVTDIGFEDKHFNSKGCLSGVRALREVKGDDGPEFLRWASALAAARLADPEFFWEVLFFDGEDGASVPYMKAGEGYFVAVRTEYAGCSHVEILPLMNSLTYEVLLEPDAADWNRGVMRALAKSIATQTGYGISLYVGDEPVLAGHEPPSEEELASLEVALQQAGRSGTALLTWLQVGGDDLSVISRLQYQRAMEALGAKPS